jgi:hypothetical protein
MREDPTRLLGKDVDPADGMLPVVVVECFVRIGPGRGEQRAQLSDLLRRQLLGREAPNGPAYCW